MTQRSIEEEDAMRDHEHDMRRDYEEHRRSQPLLDQLAEQAANRHVATLFEANYDWVGPIERSAVKRVILAAIKEATQAQREQREQQRLRLEEWPKQHTAVLALHREAEAELDQCREQFSQVTQERDNRFIEAEMRELMMRAWEDGTRHQWEKSPDTVCVMRVDKLLAEHKAQQPCATPTNSSPSAATDTRS